MPVTTHADGDVEQSLDLRLALPALAAWLTAWLIRPLPAALIVGGAAVLMLSALVLLVRPGRRSAALAAICVCAGAACLAVASRTTARTADPLPQLAQQRAAVTVTGVLTDDPRLAAPAPGRQGRADLHVIRLRAESLEWAGRSVHLGVPMLVLSTDPTWLGLLPSQSVRVEGRLGGADPGDDIAAVVSGRGPPEVLGGPSAVQRAAGHLRAGLREAVSPLPDAEAGLLPGLVVGDTSRLDPALREDFRTTGLTHLTAVSGTNVSIVVLAALLLTRVLGVPLRARPWVAGVVLVGFVILARPSPSVLRAAVMGSVGLLALAHGTRRLAMPSLAGAVLVLVLLQPDLAAAPGFALSVLATAGLLVLAPPWRARLATRMPGWLADALAVPAAAQVACGPVVVAISGELGLVGIPANLLAVPAVAPATVLGVGAALLAPVSLPLAQLAAWLAYLPTAWLVLIARHGADVPGSSFPWPDGASGALLLAALTAIGLVLLSRPLLRRVTAAMTVGSVISALVLSTARPAWPPPGWFLVTCDVGQGDGHVLKVGEGAAVVIDVGPDPEAMDRCLRRLDISVVPLVLLTHQHADHVQGLSGLLRGRRVARLETGPLEEPAQQHRDVLAQAAAHGVPTVQASLGERRRVAEVTWEVLAPTRAFRGTNSDPNNSSLVLRVEIAGIRVLFTGDVEPEAQRALLDSGVDLRADVLKVPHHGSRHQLPEFLDAIGARVAVTSVGADNTYGHPDAAVLGRLVAQGARSLRTDVDGDIALALRDGRLVAVGRG